MTMIWYPGRIPMCAADVVQGLTSYIDVLECAVRKRDTTYVQVAERIRDDIHSILWAEARACLGSDTDINDMMTLLRRSQQAAQLCAIHDRWEDLNNVIDAVNEVRCNLIGHLNEMNEDDYVRPSSETETIRPGRIRTDEKASLPGEEEGSDQEESQQEAEEALRSSDAA